MGPGSLAPSDAPECLCTPDLEGRQLITAPARPLAARSATIGFSTRCPHLTSFRLSQDARFGQKVLQLLSGRTV